jgi:hypothetical protein
MLRTLQAAAERRGDGLVAVQIRSSGRACRLPAAAEGALPWRTAEARQGLPDVPPAGRVSIPENGRAVRRMLRAAFRPFSDMLAPL